MMSVENPGSLSSEVRKSSVDTPAVGRCSFTSELSHVSPQARVKIMGKMPEETKGPLMKLHNCLNGKVRDVSCQLHRQPAVALKDRKPQGGPGFLTICSSQTIEDFLTNIETCAEVCGFMLKKGDKKKER